MDVDTDYNRHIYRSKSVDRISMERKDYSTNLIKKE